ncbi:hypothetical protein ACFWIQ_25320 [Kitasatospora sp. NPDC127059]|uniref:hypothetical protein n=1 Tax=unclassified Kitasatospora TaxID=2633591 RepID=UPI00365479D6
MSDRTAGDRTASAPVTTRPAADDTRPVRAVRGRVWSGILWLAWRQHRAALIGFAAVTAVLLVWMAVNAAELRSAMDLCHGSDCTKAVADERAARIRDAADLAGHQLNLVVFLPAMIGTFLGVPLLAKEYEHRTLLLAWSQDLSPQRWLFGKLAVLGTAVAVLSAALAAECLHVSQLVHLADRRSLFEGTLFQAGGWMPLTLGLTWAMFGVAAGAALRRLLPAFAVVLGAFGLRNWAMEQLRPHLLDPLTRVLPLGPDRSAGADPLAAVPNELLLDGGKAPFVDAAGHVHAYGDVMTQYCGSIPDGRGDAFVSCLQQQGLVGVQQAYQPASRLGIFHLIENGLNLTVFVLSLALTWWLVRRGRTTV